MNSQPEDMCISDLMRCRRAVSRMVAMSTRASGLWESPWLQSLAQHAFAHSQRVVQPLLTSCNPVSGSKPRRRGLRLGCDGRGGGQVAPAGGSEKERGAGVKACSEPSSLADNRENWGFCSERGRQS